MKTLEDVIEDRQKQWHVILLELMSVSSQRQRGNVDLGGQSDL